MCSTSIIKGECFQQGCRFRNVKGTNFDRNPTRSEKTPDRNTIIASRDKHGKNEKDNKAKPDHLLEAMDSKLAVILSQLHQQQPVQQTLNSPMAMQYQQLHQTIPNNPPQYQYQQTRYPLMQIRPYQ